MSTTDTDTTENALAEFYKRRLINRGPDLNITNNDGEIIGSVDSEEFTRFRRRVFQQQ